MIDWLYLAVTLALSSTLIVVKLLYDKLELTTLPGRITRALYLMTAQARATVRRIMFDKSRDSGLESESRWSLVELSLEEVNYERA